jgi:2-amino-4-hydroxy-6-hydroxymethyldihydropteridine diphosphokinase
LQRCSNWRRSSAGGRDKSPREIDLDLLVYGHETRDSESLRLPHPGIPERDFVLYPLRDVAADLYIPGLGRVRDLAERVSNRGVQRLA